MLSSLAFLARMKRLEAQRQGTEGHGICAILAEIRRHGAAPERPRLDVLTDEELDTKRVALIGEPGFALLLLECVEAELARRETL